MNSALIRNIINKKYIGMQKYEIFKNAVIATDNTGKKLVAKKNGSSNIVDIYNYLNSRGFDYLPKLLYYNDNGYVYEYEKSAITPSEQKINDIVKIVALLHNKTAYYKEISIDEIKKIYEDLSLKIEDTFKYYDNLISQIETVFYPSPSNYLLLRNCSTIFSCLNFCRNELNSWYEIVSKKTKIREVLLHNNLDFDHLIRNTNNYLISWDKASQNIPIYDFIHLYKNNYNKYDFNHLYREYNKYFPLLQEEKMLMFIILFIPDKIYFTKNEISSTIKVANLCNYLFITDKLFMENKTKYSEEQNHNINE